MLYGNRETIKYCEGKNDDGITHLNEFIGDKDNSQIEINDILYLVVILLISNKTFETEKIFDENLKKT